MNPTESAAYALVRSEHRPSPRPRSNVAATVLVWGSWVVLVAAALGYVLEYGSNVPFYDDWDLIAPSLTRQSGTEFLDWLWSQHASHRIPLPRWLLLTLYKLTGFDFRMGMLFSVFALGALAAGLIWAARKVRKRTNYTDAVFPLLLLHWGHSFPLLWSFQVGFTLPLALIGIIFFVIVTQEGRAKLQAGILAGFCLLLLPLCGSNGVAFVPALAVWLMYQAFLHGGSRIPKEKSAAWILGGLAVGAILLVGLYFKNLQKDFEAAAKHATLVEIASTALQLMTLNLRPVAGPLWPLSGLLMLLLLLGGAGFLVRTIVQKRAVDRPRALGLFLFLGAIASLALGFGWGRAFRGSIVGDARWECHYSLLAVPAIFAAYFMWSIYGPSRFRSLVPWALLIFLVIAWPFHAWTGTAYGSEVRSRLHAFEQDLQRGDPPYALLERHWLSLCPTPTAEIVHDQDGLARLMELLKDAHIGLFQELRGNPPAKALSLPVTPWVSPGATWNRAKRTGQGTAANSYLTFQLPRPMFVYCIRVRCHYSDDTGAPFPIYGVNWKEGAGDSPGTGQFWWRRDETAMPRVPVQFFNYAYGVCSPDPATETLVIYVHDTLGQFRLYPNIGPWRVTIQEITLSVAEADAPAKR